MKILDFMEQTNVIHMNQGKKNPFVNLISLHLFRLVSFMQHSIKQTWKM